VGDSGGANNLNVAYNISDFYQSTGSNGGDAQGARFDEATNQYGNSNFPQDFWFFRAVNVDGQGASNPPLGDGSGRGGLTLVGTENFAYLVADFNFDGRVDVADLGILATNFNERPSDPTGRAGGDANLDGGVDVSDLGILATFFNQPFAGASFEQALAAYPNLQAAVPEPAGALALCAGGGLLALRRRRGIR
jgi:hypothetical protein